MIFLWERPECREGIGITAKIGALRPLPHFLNRSDTAGNATGSLDFARDDRRLNQHADDAGEQIASQQAGNHRFEAEPREIVATLGR